MSLAKVISDQQQWAGPSWEARIAGILTYDLGQNFSVCFDLVSLIIKLGCAHAASIFRDL